MIKTLKEILKTLQSIDSTLKRIEKNEIRIFTKGELRDSLLQNRNNPSN